MNLDLRRKTEETTRAARFLARFERIKKTIEEEERVLSLFDHSQAKTISQFEGLQPEHCAVLAYLAPTKNEVSDRLFFHYRLFEKFCAALGAAIRRIPDKCLRDYLIWHYFYQFTHEAIAEVMNYSVRQIYRQGARARTALSKALHLPPQAKAHKNRRYRATFHAKPLPLKRAS